VGFSSAIRIEMKSCLSLTLFFVFFGLLHAAEATLPDRSGEQLEGDLTGYYIKNIRLKADGKGNQIALTNLDGNRVEYWLEHGEYKQAEMQAVAQAEKLDGSFKSIYRIREGEWIQLPPGSMGMGNRMNPLVPFHHVAADQSFWPFGSMIYCKEMDGRKTMDGKIHDGFFWVADVGGLIKGRNRFDIFVGKEKVFLDLLDKYADPEKEPKEQFEIFPLPRAPSADLDPLKGIKPVIAILRGKGYELTGEERTDEDIEKELTKFQKTHRKIRAAEYGNRRGATTLWFLMAAAHEVAEAVESQ
jgi:3D (Asp-Asp-Asp) domain-containing protein